MCVEIHKDDAIMDVELGVETIIFSELTKGICD